MTNLMAWWDFDETAGATSYPSHDSASAYELSSGSTSFLGTTNPKTGTGHLSHDGSDPGSDVPALASNATLNFSDSFTICGWVRPTGAIPATELDKATVLSKWRATTGQRGYWLSFYASGFSWELGGSGSPVLIGTPTVDQYSYFSVWYDAQAGEVGIQIDGEVATASFTGTPQQPDDVPFAFLTIGSGFGGWDTSNNVGSADIDAVSVWNRALNRTERDIIRNNGDGWTYATFPGLTQTPEQQFNLTYADVSGRDPLATALTQRTPAKQLVNYLVSLYAGTNPRIVSKPVHIEAGEIDKTSPAPASGDLSRQIWIEDDRDPNFAGGRWATILGRSGGADPGTVELTLFIADNPESFVEPT